MLQGDVDRFTTEALAFEAQAADASLQLDAAQQRAEDAAAALYRGSDAPVYAAVLDADNVHDAYVGTKYLAAGLRRAACRCGGARQLEAVDRSQRSRGRSAT